MTIDLPRFRQRRLTHGPANHFFGYYGMSPWNRAEDRLVCLEPPFHDRLPTAGEPAKIGLVDQTSGEFAPIAETRAWNLQQGALTHWNPLQPDREIIFNDRMGEEFHATVLDVDTGRRRRFGAPVSGVGTTGRYALSLTWGRLSRLRGVVGYAGAEDPNAHIAHPEDDGVFRVDLETGESELLVSIRQVFDMAVPAYPALRDRHLWFNHTVMSSDGERFFFLARSHGDHSTLDSGMFTARMDGSELRQVIPFGTGVSHFDWRNGREIIATFTLPGTAEMKHYLFTDGEEDYRAVGDGFLVGDGHCTFAPDGNWLATDRQETQRLAQSLWWYEMQRNTGMLLASHPAGDFQFLHSDIRCDFHPRWSPSGTSICYDAIDSETWTRQLYLIEFL